MLIQNKSDKPIYIDWKKSSFIINDYKFNYWEDKEVTQTLATSLGHSVISYNKNFNYRYLNMWSGNVMTSTSTKSKPEQITFIPPNSKIIQISYTICPTPIKKIRTLGKIKEVGDFNNIKKKNIVCEATFAKENSPVIFRNFLTYSDSESFKTESHIDNDFFVSKVTETPLNHFKGKITITKKREILYENFYEKPTSFYYKIKRNSKLKK